MTTIKGSKLNAIYDDHRMVNYSAECKLWRPQKGSRDVNYFAQLYYIEIGCQINDIWYY